MDRRDVSVIYMSKCCTLSRSVSDGNDRYTVTHACNFLRTFGAIDEHLSGLTFPFPPLCTFLQVHFFISLVFSLVHILPLPSGFLFLGTTPTPTLFIYHDLCPHSGCFLEPLLTFWICFSQAVSTFLFLLFRFYCVQFLSDGFFSSS